MTRRLIIEAYAALTRAVEIDEDGHACNFYFAPPLEAPSASIVPKAGDIYRARVKTLASAIQGAYLDLGHGVEGFYPYGNESPPVEGALYDLCVRRAATPGKLAIFSSNLKKYAFPGDDIEQLCDGQRDEVGRLSPRRNAMGLIAQEIAWRGISGVVVDSPALMSAAKAVLPAVIIEQFQQGTIEWDEIQSMNAQFDDAFEVCIALSGGARLLIEQTHGGGVIDIDSGALAAHGRAINDRVNEEAASLIPKALSVRGLGGAVFIDFLPPSNAAAAKRLTALLRAQDGELRVEGPSAQGHCVLTRPRKRLSLLEMFTDDYHHGLAVAGRRWKTEMAAALAVMALEQRLRRLPKARLSLIVGEQIEAYINAQAWLARLSARYGARFTVKTKAGVEEREMEGHDYDIVEE